MESPLKQWRKKKGIKQSDLAASAGISQSHVSEAEKGRAPLGEKLESLLKISGQNGRDVIELHLIYLEFIKRELLSKIEGN